MNEPIEDRGQLDEGKKRAGQFLVAGTDAAVAFDPAKEFFDFLSLAIVPAVKGDAPTARRFRRNAGAGALLPQAGTESVGIKPFVAR